VTRSVGWKLCPNKSLLTEARGKKKDQERHRLVPREYRRQ
jgi:hypothetical protein